MDNFGTAMYNTQSRIAECKNFDQEINFNFRGAQKGVLYKKTARIP